MDQKQRPSYFTMIQTPTPITCQIITSQISSAIVSPSTSNYVLTSSSLRPIGNYTLVASSQVPVTHQYMVQSTTRPTVPQYVSTGNVRHILSSSSQQSNVTRMLPSGAQIVRMNNVITTTIAGNPKSNTQFILTSSTQKINPNVVSPLGSQSLKPTIASVSESSSVMVSRTIGVTTTTTPILQRAGINLPRLNTAYYSQIKANDSPKILFRPKLNEQKPGTSYILTSNDWPRTKNVPISSLQKINTNFTQIPLIQKPGAVLSTNTIRSNVDIQQQRPQHQSIRSVFLPSNFQTNSVSQQQGTDCKLVLNSINIAPQVLSSNDISTSNTAVANIQQLNTNYMQIPIAQKPGTILTRSNLQPNMESNVRIGQQQQAIRSVILPSNYRATMVPSPRKGVDYRLILKPVNIQSQVLRSMPSSRFTSPRNPSVRNASPRQTSCIRPTAFSSSIPLNRPSTSKIQNEVVDLSKITPISQRRRKNKLIITDRSIKICVEEINSKKGKDDEPDLIISESAIKLIQYEVTYRLFYLLRECKKVLCKIRSNVLTEEAVRLVCSEYFTTFYGNKLWPLFCLKPDNNNEEDPVWMRKHNNVNLIGWLKHPKFRNPSYIKKRRKSTKIKPAKNTSSSKTEKETNVPNLVYEFLQPSTIDETSMELLPPSQTFIQSLKNDKSLLNNVLSNEND